MLISSAVAPPAVPVLRQPIAPVPYSLKLNHVVLVLLRAVPFAEVGCASLPDLPSCRFPRLLLPSIAASLDYCSQGKKPKLGLRESFRVLGKSKYLGFLATLVLGYGLCIAMTEGACGGLGRKRSNKQASEQLWNKECCGFVSRGGWEGKGGRFSLVLWLRSFDDGQKVYSFRQGKPRPLLPLPDKMEAFLLDPSRPWGLVRMASLFKGERLVSAKAIGAARCIQHPVAA